MRAHTLGKNQNDHRLILDSPQTHQILTNLTTNDLTDVPKLEKWHHCWNTTVRYCSTGTPKCVRKSPGACWHNPGRMWAHFFFEFALMRAQTLGQSQNDHPRLILDSPQTHQILTKLTTRYFQIVPKEMAPLLKHNCTILQHRYTKMCKEITWRLLA